MKNKEKREYFSVKAHRKRCASRGEEMAIKNIISYGWRGKHKRWKCTRCGKVFTNDKSSFFYRLRTDKNKILKAIKLLVENKSIRKAARETGIRPNTLCDLLKRLRKSYFYYEEVKWELIRNGEWTGKHTQMLHYFVFGNYQY